MGLFRKQGGSTPYEIVRETGQVILRLNYQGTIEFPSLEDNPNSMREVIDKLMQIGNVTKIVLVQRRDIEYDEPQVLMLYEIANILKHLIRNRQMFSAQALSYGDQFRAQTNRRFIEMQNIVFNLLKSDPLGAYVELKRKRRTEKIEMQQTTDSAYARFIEKYIKLINYIMAMLEKTKLIRIAKEELPGYVLGRRNLYRKYLVPSIKPDFMNTKVMSKHPDDAEELDSYMIGEDVEVTIYKFPDSVKYLYHVLPPEFKLTEEQYEILDMAKKIMSEHRPKRAEFIEPGRMRKVFFNVGKDLIDELATQRGHRFKEEDIEMLTNILVRYTVGFGLVEVLLRDEKMQDISVNSPFGSIPIFIVHSEFDDCYTNIIPTQAEAESWATKLRLISGRPLDEANPILDSELELPGANTRISVITKPLNPTGLGFSFRRHRDKPWTLPLFIQNKTISPLGAGLLSFLIDGTRSILVAGTRSSGKTSFLSALLIEIMRRYRIITVEDTLELPTPAMRKLGYNIQAMKVTSALSFGTTGVDASDGIRCTLRLGDSSLIVGEVRSKEAQALYEAMRVGAAANVVAGTIHSDSPYGVYDRVVNDIGVPNTSFKATDIICIVNPIKSADGLHKFRRALQITEVRKDWEKDPSAEGGFVDLMRYDAKKDLLEPTSDLLNGDSEILKLIAGKVKEFAGNWDAVWENIELRAKMKQTLAEYAVKINDMDLLEAPSVIKSNDVFHIVSSDVKKEVGSLDAKQIYNRWESWLRMECKRRALK